MGIIPDVEDQEETSKREKDCVLHGFEAVLRTFFKGQGMRWEICTTGSLDQGKYASHVNILYLSSEVQERINAFKEENNMVKFTGLKGHTGCWVEKNRENTNGSFQFNNHLWPQAIVTSCFTQEHFWCQYFTFPHSLTLFFFFFFIWGRWCFNT